MSDEELLLLLARWGITPTILLNSILLFILAVFVSLNVLLFRRYRRAQKESSRETVMDWRQTTDELEIDFPLPAAQRPARSDVVCRITSRTIHFAFVRRTASNPRPPVQTAGL